MILAVLFTLAWKSTVLSGLALVIVKICERRAPTDRALILKIGIGSLLLLPVLASFLPAVRVALPTLPPHAPLEVAQAGVTAGGRSLVVRTPARYTVSELISAFYQAGVAALVLQFVIGAVLLARWTEAAREVTSGKWYEFLEQSCRNARPPKLLASPHVTSPLSWGIFQPVILVNERSLADPTTATAILAHELAHIRNKDWATLVFARLAVALFWFNPLVWLLVRWLEQQMEEVADRAAARLIGPADYAQVLVSEGRRVVQQAIPAVAMAAQPSRLSRRVNSLLGERCSAVPFRTRGKLAGVAGAALTVPFVAMLAFVSGRAASAPRAPMPVHVYPAAMRTALQYAPPTIPRAVERRRHAPPASNVISRSSSGLPKSALQDGAPQLDAADQMQRQAEIVDAQAAAVDAQARTLRNQSSTVGVPLEARQQAEQQAATLESAAAAMRLSAAGTRANAIATRRNERLQNRLSQAP